MIKGCRDREDLPILSIEGGSQVENGFVTFTVRLSEAPTDAVTVDFQTYAGTATLGSDVRGNISGGDPLAGTLTFAPGEQVQTIELFVGSDSLDELDESFAVELTNPVGASFGGANQSLQAVGWALDDDGAGVNRTIAVSDPTVVEQPGGVAVFAIELSQPSTVPITLNYETVGQSASSGRDFVATTGQVTFAPGQTHAEVLVPLKTDTGAEAAESFTLNLVPPYPSQVSAATGTQSGTATILDYALKGTSNGETLTGTGSPERIEAYGGDDRLSAGGGNDLLYGGGNDTLDGGSGDDRMEGGAGNDLYEVDDLGDRVIEAGGSGTDSVDSLITFVLPSTVENLVLVGSDAVDGTGNAAKNRITGNAAANDLSGGDSLDTISRGNGSDSIIGGRGADVMTGGAGADDFVFSTAADSKLGVERDSIRDFAKGQDDIVLSAIDADVTIAGNQAFRLDAGGAFKAGEIRQTQKGSDLLIELNLDADADPEMSILLEDVTGALAASDFVF